MNPPPVSLLLVDDTPANLVALKAVLKDTGYRLLTARSGEEALRLALREDIAVILLDVVMPGMDGFEVARHLKELERTRDIPVLFLTAMATDAEKIYRAYEVGAVDFVTKPLAPEMVRRKVAVFVELVRQREALREADRARFRAEEAERAVHAREELLTVVAHDLRNPLNAITLAAAMLARADDEAVRHRANTVLRATHQMQRLVGDLLDFAQLEAGRLIVELHPTGARALIDECLELFAPVAEQKRLQLSGEADDALELNADRDRLLQILSNLIANALRVTVPPGAVTIRAQRHGPEAVFTVSDTGPGMSDEEVAQLWDHGQLKQTALGLGLSICRGLVEAQGGRIWVERKPGGGTSFHFAVPLVPAEEHAAGVN